MAARRSLTIGGRRIRLGETRDIRIGASQMYTGEGVYLPVRVIRAKRSGPIVFLTAAVHGDEINGVGIVREVLFGDPLDLVAGTLICVPVINVFGFESNSRYMPDRRDLNRCFPGTPRGSLSSRFANLIMREVVEKCDFGLDLHSAAATRTNYPNVRGDLRKAEVRELANAVGCELVVNGRGPEGSLRRAACDIGCPTVILEAGEVNKIEPSVLDVGVQGVRNVLVHLGMLPGTLTRPAYQVRVNRTMWIRAELGGLLRFHVAPGALVRAGQPLASNESIFGESQSVLIAPADGIILGMTTHPAVKPGEPVCNIALPGRGIASIAKALEKAPKESHEVRLRGDLAASLAVSPADIVPTGRPARGDDPPTP